MLLAFLTGFFTATLTCGMIFAPLAGYMQEHGYSTLAQCGVGFGIPIVLGIMIGVITYHVEYGEW